MELVLRSPHADERDQSSLLFVFGLARPPRPLTPWFNVDADKSPPASCTPIGQVNLQLAHSVCLHEGFYLKALDPLDLQSPRSISGTCQDTRRCSDPKNPQRVFDWFNFQILDGTCSLFLGSRETKPDPGPNLPARYLR